MEAAVSNADTLLRRCNHNIRFAWRSSNSSLPTLRKSSLLSHPSQRPKDPLPFRLSPRRSHCSFPTAPILQTHDPQPHRLYNNQGDLDVECSDALVALLPYPAIEFKQVYMQLAVPRCQIRGAEGSVMGDGSPIEGRVLVRGCRGDVVGLERDVVGAPGSAEDNEDEVCEERRSRYDDGAEIELAGVS